MSDSKHNIADETVMDNDYTNGLHDNKGHRDDEAEANHSNSGKLILMRNFPFTNCI